MGSAKAGGGEFTYSFEGSSCSPHLSTHNSPYERGSILSQPCPWVLAAWCPNPTPIKIKKVNSPKQP